MLQESPSTLPRSRNGPGTVLYSNMTISSSITTSVTSPPPSKTRINQQVLASQVGGLTLTNLQTYTLKP